MLFKSKQDETENQVESSHLNLCEQLNGIFFTGTAHCQAAESANVGFKTKFLH